jgi:hypothetical protein
MNETYKIVRHYYKTATRRTIKTGLTLTLAQEHCHSPETSSRTCTSPKNKFRTKKYGAWFDGYAKE